MSSGSAEYAISTRKYVHGTGATALATKEVLRIAFEKLGLKTVYLNVLEENERASHFYRKMGFEFQRKEEHAVEIKGVWKTLNWYNITNSK